MHGKLCNSSTSSSSCICCQDLQSENEALKSHNTHLLSKISTKIEEIEDNRRKVKKSQHNIIKLYSLHRNSIKKVLRRDQNIKLKKQEVTELVVNLEKS